MTKITEGPSNQTAFRQAERIYKRRKPPADFSACLDTASMLNDERCHLLIEQQTTHDFYFKEKVDVFSVPSVPGN